MWDPAVYLAFGDHRARPFHDLIARVGAVEPRAVVDLGCGPGTLTAVLARRWPGARIEALDSSPEMVAEARARGIDAAVGGVEAWVPAGDVDVVVANAVLHWVPSHPDLLRRWVEVLPAEAWLAVQVPGNHIAPSHREIFALAREPRWREALASVDPNFVLEPVEYAALLTQAGAEADVWETTYAQRLTGPDPVLGWLAGTTLRPIQAALAEEEWARFRAELAPRLRAAYPPAADGSTWFPFRRIFMVARTRR